MDPSEALTLPGVKAYVNSDDVPGSNAIGYYSLDEEVFATEKVRVLKNNMPGLTPLIDGVVILRDANDSWNLLTKTICSHGIKP